MRNNFKLFVVLLALFAYQNSATAQILTALNSSSPDIINSIPTSTVASDGYYFFDDKLGTSGPGGNVFSLPSYVTGVSDDGNQLYAGNYTNLTIGGSSYGTGVVFNSVSSTIPTINLLTVTLGSDTPADFKFGIASVFGGETSSYDLTLYNSTNTVLSTTTIANTFHNPGNNSFFFADVSGAISGDYLVLAGTGTNQVTLGGVTFDAVPEPSTYALLGLGVVLLFGVQRYRRAA